MLGDFHRLTHQLAVRNHPLSESDPIGFSGGQRKAERQPHRESLADPACRAQCSTLRWQDAQRRLWQAPFSALRRHDQITTECENAADADRVAVDRRDYRLREVSDL